MPRLTKSKFAALPTPPLATLAATLFHRRTFSRANLKPHCLLLTLVIAATSSFANTLFAQSLSSSAPHSDEAPAMESPGPAVANPTNHSSTGISKTEDRKSGNKKEASDSSRANPTASESRPTVSAKRTGKGQVLLVDNFESPLQNQVGGYRNPFQKHPSSATFYRTRDRDGEPNDRGYSLCVKGDRRKKGWCGSWVHLFDHEANATNWFDARPYDYLSIWIRGETGTEEISIKVADKFWYTLEDSWVVARTSRCLPRGITKQWQEIRIPIAKMRRLNPEKLATIVIEFERPGEQTIYLDDISFRTESGLSVELPQKKYKQIANSNHPPQSLWVWQTEELITNTAQRRELFDFCNRRNIRSIWLQMLYKVEEVDGVKKAKIKFPKQFRRLNAEASAFGIEVHALDGYPEYALKELQFVPITLTKTICEFNKSANGNERFNGVHFDNEPHLLVGWHSPKHRRQILKEFLALNQKCQQLITESGHMQYGIDIPFWWEETDPLTRRPCGEVTFNGATKPASFHCIDMLDNVGVMNYRDMADGADGMIIHGHALLEYANQNGNCDMFMGVETFAYPFQTVEFLYGLPREKFYEALDGSAKKLGRLSRIHNYRIRVFDDGKSIHIGLEHPEDPAKFNRQTFDLGLDFIAQQLNLRPLADGKVDWKRFSQALARSGEYKDVQYQPFVASDKRYHGLHATAFMSPKITFADQTLAEFNLQTKLATEYFAKFKKFSGIAIHCYDTFKEMK